MDITGETSPLHDVLLTPVTSWTSYLHNTVTTDSAVCSGFWLCVCRVSVHYHSYNSVSFLVFLLFSNLIYFECSTMSLRPPHSISATHRHGNYGPKLARYFTEWHFFLSSISELSTHFSVHAFGGIVQLLSLFLSSPAILMPLPPSCSLHAIPLFLISFIKIARQKSLLITYKFPVDHY